MTPSDAVQNAYRWALDTSANKKSSMMQLWAAKHVQTAFESSDRYDEAYGTIAGLVAQWKVRLAKQRPPCEGLRKSVEVLTMLLGLEDATDQTEPAAALPSSHPDSA